MGRPFPTCHAYHVYGSPYASAPCFCIFHGPNGSDCSLEVHTPMTTLHATPPPNNANGRSSSTARDSAAHVEWEPLTELQRRIEDGVNYEHWPDDEAFRGDFADEDEPERVQGVFFGYRVTKEDYDRLKSADPDDPDTFDI